MSNKYDLDSILEEFEDSPKKKGGFFNSLFSKKEKESKTLDEELKTVDDLHEERTNLVGKTLLKLFFVGVGLLIIITLYQTIKYISNYKTVKHTKQEVPAIEFNISDGDWKKSVEKRIDEIHDEVNQTISAAIQKQNATIKKELNVTLTSVQKALEEIKKSNNKLKNSIEVSINSIKSDVGKIKEQVQKNSKAIQALRSGTVNKIRNVTLIPLKKGENASGATNTTEPKIPPLKRVISGQKQKNHIISSNNENKEQEKTKEQKEVETDIALEEDTVPETGSYIEKKEQQKKQMANKTLIGMKTGFVDAVLITGVSAPTFAAGQKSPKPVLLSLIGYEYLANDYKANLDGCFAIATASGNIITSRAELLITKITCNYKKNGKMYEITQPVKGWVIDADGQYGVQGRLVDSSGKVLTKSMIMGMLQGFSNMVTNTAQAYSNALMQSNAGTGNEPNLAKIATSNFVNGTATGFSNGFAIISDYYKKIIDAYFPYVSVKAGRKVTILFNGGEAVTEKQVNIIDIHKDEYEEDLDNEVEIEIENEDY